MTSYSQFVLTEWSRSSLARQDVDLRPLRRDQVRVEVRAITLNPRDLVVMEGGYGRRGGSLPLVPLSDCAGVVVETGADVVDWSPGDRVIPSFASGWRTGQFDGSQWSGFRGGPASGVASEIIDTVPGDLVRLPNDWTFEEGAALPCAGVTAFNAVRQSGLGPDEEIVIQGTGGVALMALQISKALGLRPVVLTSSDQKQSLVEGLGAHAVIRYDQVGDWWREVRLATRGEGARAVIEVAGEINSALKAVRAGARILAIGVLDEDRPPLDVGRVVTQNIAIQGVTAGPTDLLVELVQLFEKQGVRPVLDRERFSFEHLPQALDHLASRRHTGKIAVTVGQSHD